MNENVKAFLKAAAADAEWMEQQKKIEDKSEAVAAAVAKAAELGIPLTEADFEAPEGELSEDELEAVAGAGNCYCLAGGGGTDQDAPSCEMSGHQDQVCWCVVWGEGWESDFTGYDNTPSGEHQRCECPMVGNGY